MLVATKEAPPLVLVTGVCSGRLTWLFSFLVLLHARRIHLFRVLFGLGLRLAALLVISGEYHVILRERRPPTCELQIGPGSPNVSDATAALKTSFLVIEARLLKAAPPFIQNNNARGVRFLRHETSQKEVLPEPVAALPS